VASGRSIRITAPATVHPELPSTMRDTAAALAWLVSHDIPFQAVGGLAAQAHGASRPLNDLDFYIPIQRIEEVAPDLAPFLTRLPSPYRDSRVAWIWPHRHGDVQQGSALSGIRRCKFPR